MKAVNYWNQAAKDPEVDVKYICDVPLEDCLKDLLPMSGEVLEIGCGVGRLMQDGWYGVDISQEMLDIAIKRNPKLKLKRIDGSLPYKDNKFDDVFSYLVFQHITTIELGNYISEAYRVLKTGGKLQFQYIDGNEDEPFSKHRPTELYRKLLENVGFNNIRDWPSKAHPMWLMMSGEK